MKWHEIPCPNVNPESKTGARLGEVPMEKGLRGRVCGRVGMLWGCSDLVAKHAGSLTGSPMGSTKRYIPRARAHGPPGGVHICVCNLTSFLVNMSKSRVRASPLRGSKDYMLCDGPSCPRCRFCDVLGRLVGRLVGRLPNKKPHRVFPAGLLVLRRVR